MSRKPLTDEAMASSLRAKGWKVIEPVNQDTCLHLRRNGTGSMSYTGAGKGKWTCSDCGLTREWSIPADPKRVQAMAHGFY
jgi:hypothetical protein